MRRWDRAQRIPHRYGSNARECGAARVLRAGPILLCMGLFSRFCARPCVHARKRADGRVEDARERAYEALRRVRDTGSSGRRFALIPAPLAAVVTAAAIASATVATAANTDPDADRRARSRLVILRRRTPYHHHIVIGLAHALRWLAIGARGRIGIDPLAR